MKTIVFDAHCDTPVALWQRGALLAQNSGQVSLARSRRLDGYAQLFSFCTPWLNDGLDCHARYLAAYAYFIGQLAQNAADIRLCRDAHEAQTAMAAGQCAAFLSIEGAEALNCDVALLETAYTQGVRMVTPVWNYENPLGGSCVTGGGLTARGVEFCRAARACGMLLDVSHLSERAFWQLCELGMPVLASHSNARAVCDHPRNLTDAQFRALCQLGGVAGINLYAEFLRADAPATLDDVYRHIDHFLELDGDGHIALGGDLDGCDCLPQGFTGVDDYTKLQDYLAARGYSPDTLENLFYKSLMKVVKECIM